MTSTIRSSTREVFARLVVISLLASSLIGTGLEAQTGDEFREWTNTRGEAIEARMIRENADGTIRLLRRDGWQGDVSLDLFSEADRQWVELQRTAAAMAEAEAKQSEAFEIASMRRSQIPGFVSTPEGWEHRIEGVQVEVRYKGEESSVSAYVKAYFFDRDAQLVGFFEKAPRRQVVRNGPYSEAPESFTRDQREELFFPITRAITAARWRSVLVVFGNDSEATARSIPSNSNWLAYEFPEKRLLFPDWNEELAHGGGATGATGAAGTETEGDSYPGLELRRIQRGQHRHATRFNDSWQSGRLCLSGEIRCNERPPGGDLVIRAFFYNDGKRLVESRDTPTMTNMGGSTYVRLPDIARPRQWYPFFFALDGVLESGNWRWAVIYAEADGEGTASLFGPTGAALEDFDFPGKDKLRGEAAEVE